MTDNYHEPEDLLSDESFLSWYFKTGDEKGHDWEGWMSAHPEKASLVQQAVELLDATRFMEREIPPQQVRNAETALLSYLNAASPVPKLPLYRDRRWIAAACIFVALLIGLIITRNHLTGKGELRTEYGQISHRQLSDGTEVTLNANSRLSFSQDWKDGSDREVWMNGEAFFQVARTPMKSRFIVHTDRVDIIVTGTRFNVVNRTGRTNILLEEGSVFLHCCNDEELKLKPGDFAELHSDHLTKRLVRKDSVTAWKDQRLFFDRTPLRDLVSIINDQYGVRVHLASEGIGDSTITAMLANDNLDVLLKALEATAEFEIIHQSDSSITIRAREN